MRGNVVRFGLICACVGLALAIPGIGRADILPHPRVKVGVFLPQNTSVRDSIGDAWLKLGADVNLPIGLPLLGSETRLGIDYAVKGGSTIVPITLSQVWQPSVLVHNPLYVGAGVGVWTLHLSGQGTTSRLGLRLLAGVDLGSKAFVEAQYDFVQRSRGTSVDGLSLMVGTRF